jgi:carboxypeptidase C (cathepsin A)
MISPPAVSPLQALPGYGPVKERQLAGYLPVSEHGDAYIYIWYVENAASRPDAPIVLWLNGGPGTSSFIGFFCENGPYTITQDGELADNPFSWHRVGAYLIVDQPAGTGLSVVEGPSGWARTEEKATEELVYGLQQFFVAQPDLRARKLFVFGESFAGVYIPRLARAIISNNDAGGAHINLAGIGVGDGWVYPELQQSTYGDFAYGHGLLDTAQLREVEDLYSKCAHAIHTHYPSSRAADEVCNRIEEYITRVSGGTNVYDVRANGDYDFSPIGRYLDRSDVRDALHVAPDAPQWSETSKRVGYLLERGEQDSVADIYPPLFETIPVLIYNGIYDMDCNFIGTDRWVEGLDWSYRGEFLNTPRTPWLVDGEPAGHIRQARTLTQVLVSGAGHLVPMDQPHAALALLEQFIGSTEDRTPTPEPSQSTAGASP